MQNEVVTQEDIWTFKCERNYDFNQEEMTAHIPLYNPAFRLQEKSLMQQRA